MWEGVAGGFGRGVGVLDLGLREEESVKQVQSNRGRRRCEEEELTVSSISRGVYSSSTSG